jgi:hypothetical protein
VPWYQATTKTFHRCDRRSQSCALPAARLLSDDPDEQWLDALGDVPPRALLPYRLVVGDVEQASRLTEIPQTDAVVGESVPLLKESTQLFLVWLAPQLLSAHRMMAVVEHASKVAAREQSRGTTEKKATLTDCFNLSTSKHQLDEDNERWCSTCGDNRPAWQRLNLWRLPALLCIQLKRFRASRAGATTKLDIPVEYPCDALDLHDYEECPHAPSCRRRCGS